MTGAARAFGLEPGGSGRVPSFDETYERYFDFVWRSLRRLGVPHSALDDATQEVFLVVHRRLQEFAGRSSLKTWLFGITWNVALRVLHSRAIAERGRVASTDIECETCDADTPQEQIAKREAIRLLYEILEQLGPEQRSVFVMAELEELTAPEIAELTGTPLNTVD